MLNTLLVPNRTCGECDACCTALVIDAPQLKKLADVPCAHLSATGGCGIYASRPTVCRTWHCGWRHFGELDERHRPDRCGVMLRPDTDGWVFQALVSPVQVLTSREAISLAASVALRGGEMSISMRVRVGFENARIELPSIFSRLVTSGDMEGALTLMRMAVERAAKTTTLPANLPHDLREKIAAAAPSRLAACPCGSGRRYKHCHGSVSAA